MSDVNIIEIDAANLSVVELKVAIDTAGTTAIDDLIVLRTTDSANTITFWSWVDEISINIDAEPYGKLTVVAFGAKPLTIDANQLSRVMYISAGTVNLGNLTITHGKSGSGGGIDNEGTLTLTNCTVSGNSASYSGGGIYNSGDTLTLTNCTISGNSASYSGGGIFNYGKLTLTNCTISGNSASIFDGGILNDGGSLTVTNTIIAMNCAQESCNDLFGTVSETSGNNLIGYNLFVVAPIFDALGKLTNAATLDLHLTSGSRAINAGSMDVTLPEFDLDGNARVYGGCVDIGAYEYQGPANGLTVYSTVVDTLNDSFDLNDGEWSLREALYWATGPGTITFAESIAGGTIRLNDRLDFFGMNIDGGKLGITLDAGQKSRVISTAGEVTLTGLTITGGKAAYYGGGIANAGTLMATNCTISDNYADADGGGIHNEGSSSTLTLTNCTISGNSASLGGEIYNGFYGTLTLYNSIVAGNTATNSGNDIYSYNNGTANAYNVLSSYTDWTVSESCCVYDSSKPLFTNAANGDYTLCAGSQAIDKGKNAYVKVQKDIAGKRESSEKPLI